METDSESRIKFYQAIDDDNINDMLKEVNHPEVHLDLMNGIAIQYAVSKNAHRIVKFLAFKFYDLMPEIGPFALAEAAKHNYRGLVDVFLGYNNSRLRIDKYPALIETIINSHHDILDLLIIDLEYNELYPMNDNGNKKISPYQVAKDINNIYAMEKLDEIGGSNSWI